MNLSFDQLNWSGRYLDHNGIRYFDYSASGFTFVMHGKKADAVFISDADSWAEENKAVLGVFITDGNKTSIQSITEEPNFRIILKENETRCTLFESDVEKTVCIRVMKFSEAAFGYAGLKSIKIEGSTVVESVETTVSTATHAPLNLSLSATVLPAAMVLKACGKKTRLRQRRSAPTRLMHFLPRRRLAHRCSFAAGAESV